MRLIDYLRFARIPKKRKKGITLKVLQKLLPETEVIGYMRIAENEFMGDYAKVLCRDPSKIPDLRNSPDLQN